jgi:hypothetical protein
VHYTDWQWSLVRWTSCRFVRTEMAVSRWTVNILYLLDHFCCYQGRSNVLLKAPALHHSIYLIGPPYYLSSINDTYFENMKMSTDIPEQDWIMRSSSYLWSRSSCCFTSWIWDSWRDFPTGACQDGSLRCLRLRSTTGGCLWNTDWRCYRSYWQVSSPFHFHV